MTDDLALWSEFNVAMLGATAALAGLVIVAMSVNIREIIASRALTARLAAGIAALVLAIVASGTALVPGIHPAAYGVVLIAAALFAGVFQVNASVAIFTDPEPAARARLAKSLLGFLPILAYLVGGSMAIGGAPGALAVTAAGALIAIVAAIIVAWVVLVEVLR
ncbi:MAG: hypothetical protein DI573_05550 [Microbacterium sp.]|jgi:hypothetical protein|uniref:hypothetical protein n=1 Tax=unclassified Microbacterium TaxID=2609290 RepID=UPI000DB6ABC3|nr:hypothetical protein [Microbacterium sp.]PZU39943.1 MAG: hypothetical protein DI573_05550 [Microbacterium sp.]